MSWIENASDAASRPLPASPRAALVERPRTATAIRMPRVHFTPIRYYSATHATEGEGGEARVRFRTGAGIVADSVAQAELEETRAKARGMLHALEPHR